MLNAGLRKYYNEQELWAPPVRCVGTQTTEHVFPDEPSSSTAVFVPSPPPPADDRGFPRARSDNDSTEANYSPDSSLEVEC